MSSEAEVVRTPSVRHGTKNYMTDDEWVIGGKLTILDGAQVTGSAQGAAVADSSATDVAGVNTVLNALLKSLRDAGLIAAASGE